MFVSEGEPHEPAEINGKVVEQAQIMANAIRTDQSRDLLKRSMRSDPRLLTPASWPATIV
jgi:hypothetical protein